MNPTPVRLQRSRAKGSRLVSPNGLPVVCVTRPGKWSNPFRYQPTKEKAVAVYRLWLSGIGKPIADAARVELRGKNLACWCKIGDPCHADVLLELSNAEATR